jgi:hypothetical protein
LQEGFHTTVSQHGNIGLYAGRALKLIAFYSVNFTHRFKRGIRFTRQQFNFWFSRIGGGKIGCLIVHISIRFQAYRRRILPQLDRSASRILQFCLPEARRSSFPVMQGINYLDVMTGCGDCTPTTSTSGCSVGRTRGLRGALAALSSPRLNALAGRALRSLLEPIDEPPSRNSGWRLRAIHRAHGDDKPLGCIFDNNLHQGAP